MDPDPNRALIQDPNPNTMYSQQKTTWPIEIKRSKDKIDKKGSLASTPRPDGGGGGVALSATQQAQ